MLFVCQARGEDRQPIWVSPPRAGRPEQKDDPDVCTLIFWTSLAIWLGSMIYGLRRDRILTQQTVSLLWQSVDRRFHGVPVPVERRGQRADRRRDLLRVN